MSMRRLLGAFDAWREQGETLVLATVYETLGSTYTKAGHRMLIAANGDYQGLVSGGCLEGDLAERAEQVAASGTALAVSYDLRDEADDLWGLGVGCNGLLRVLLQPLLPGQGYEPFGSIANALQQRDSTLVATIIESGRSGTEVGGTLLQQAGRARHWGIDAEFADHLSAQIAAEGGGEARLVADSRGAVVLFAPLRPIPRLLVLGAGLDAIPLVDMAADLGWRVWVADHRPGYLERGGFEAAEQASNVDPRDLARSFDLDSFDAIIVMSHHLLTDRAYLAQLAEIDVAYLGVLGPPARRQRLLVDLGDQGLGLQARLKGPVGLDIGANSPETIALSILAEIQATFAGYPRAS